MTFIESLYAFLANRTDAGSRVYPKRLPQQASLPALTYTVIDDPGEHSHDGASNLAHPRVQVDCWGSTPLQAAQLDDQVRAVLDGYQGPMGTLSVHGAMRQDARQDDDPDTGRYWVSADYIVWHSR